MKITASRHATRLWDRRVGDKPSAGHASFSRHHAHLASRRWHNACTAQRSLAHGLAGCRPTEPHPTEESRFQIRSGIS